MVIEEEKVYTVSELSALVNQELSGWAVRVRGEVSDFKRSQNGKFVYFDIKDKEARMNCFIMAFQLRQELEDGMDVIVTGSPGLYVPYGKYTFRVQFVELVGEGALKRAFELTKRKLEAEGLFLPEHKKSLPRFPERIGLITSRDAAAYSDFTRILNNRLGGVDVLFANVHVQGSDAANEIVDAVHMFNEHVPRPDVLVLTRGGGSLEDLHAFNEEQVVRAVFASKIPMIVGVGHERDVTLCDLVADVRASTPSNAAERVVPSREEIRLELDSFAVSLHSQMAQSLRTASEHIEALLARIKADLRGKIETGKTYALRLQGAMQSMIRHMRENVHRNIAMLEALNPQRVLRRGYSITRKDGRILKDASLVKQGEEIETLLHKGKVLSMVK